MLSPLTRGYGSWDGAHYDPYSEHATEEKLPLINERETHRHGVTIGHMSRCSTSLSLKSNIAPPATPVSRSEKLQRETTHNRLSRESTSVEQTNKYDLPKTYLTKKGALMLFTAPKEEQEFDDVNVNPKKVKMHRVKKLLDSTLQIGSLDRLAMSILQYGDEEEYDKENTSISEEKDKLFMKILRKAENQRELDMRSQPGSDLNSYLRDLKFRARASMSGDTNIPRSREAMELRAILQGLQDNRWPIVYNTESGTYENRSSFGDQFTRPASQHSHRPQTSPGSGTSTPRSILSASKLRASLKSYNTFMGRPATDETFKEIRSSLPTVGMRRSSAPSMASKSLDITSPGKGRRRVQSSISGGSIVEEGEYLPLYYDPLSGMGGSSIAYTDSTDLGQHMYTFDLASGESSLFDVGSHGDGNKPLGEGSVDVVEEPEKESDVEMSYVEGQGSNDVASEPQSSSNHIQVVVEDHGTNICDNSTQYEFEVESVKGGGDGVPSIKIGGGVSTNSLVDISSAISSQHDPLSETEKLDVETSTTISEDLIEPPGVNKVDIKTIAGVIPEEESVELGFDGEGVHIPQGNDEVDEGELDWEEKGEEAACTEVDLARYGIIGEEEDGEGDEIEENTDEIRVSSKPDSAQGKSPAPSPAQPTQTHDPTSPPKKGSASSQRKASLAHTGSRASSKSASPQIPKSPSPSKQMDSVSQSNKKSPSPVQKTVSPIQKPDHDKPSSVEVTKPCPSPEIRGKNTPPFVTITKKQPQTQNSLLIDAQKDTVSSPSHTVDNLPQVSSDKIQSNQKHTDMKSVKSEEALPNVPLSSSDQKEMGAPDTQQSQVMDEGAHAQTSVTTVVEKEEKSKQEDENEESHKSSFISAEDKNKKKLLQSNDEQKDDGEVGTTSKTEPEAPTRQIDQMPVIPDYLKPKPQKTPKTKEKKTKKQQPLRSKKDVTKAMSVASIQPESETTVKEKPVPKVWEHEKVEIPPEKEELVIPDHMKEAFSRDTEQSKTALEEQMKQKHNIDRITRNSSDVANILDDTFKVTIDEELLEVGLTEEELLEAKMEVEEKLNVAQAKINEMEKTGGADLESEEARKAEKEKAVKLKEGKGKKKGGKGGKSTPKDTVAKGQGKTDKELEKQKILKKEQKRTEEKKKLEEKRKLDEQIQERQELVEEHEQRTRDKELELKLEMERLMREEIEMQEAVDEVHKYLAESRKRQREERDQRRKADQERRREHAREKFEQDKKKREEDSRKVMEELDRIHDLEMRKQKKLEEEMRREEEERLAIEQAEEEENSRVKAAEDQERRLREIEVQMEEEEMQRLYLQEQEISRQRILLDLERQKMAEEEEVKRQELLAEQIKLEEIKRKKEEEEQRVLDEQRRRLLELKEMEEAAKIKMQQDLEERRAKALARREENLENKSNMDKLKQSQGITKAWVFSYFVRWPLESYMIPLGGDETQKKGFRPKSNRPKTAK